MRFEIPTKVIVLALVISLGLNVYLYFAMVDKQKMVNDIRSEIILEWANEMNAAAHCLKNATTNIDVDDEAYGVRWFLVAAFHVMEAGHQWHGEYEFYEPLMRASLDVAGNLMPYEKGARARINPIAIEMFGNLAEKIWGVTDIIFNEAHILYTPSGVNPIQRLEEKGILDDIVDGCTDILLYSNQIRDFDPKFQ